MTDITKELARHQEEMRRVNKHKQLCIGTLRELAMAHHAYQRALDEFGRALGVSMNELNGAQAKAVFDLCTETDPREVSEDTLFNLLTQLGDSK